jgi:hypothetical protein
MNIYFYTIKPILPNQELLVWYCREFAERLNYPLTGELMLQRIRMKTDILPLCLCVHAWARMCYSSHVALLRTTETAEVLQSIKGYCKQLE